jgi:hypothetical protein
MEDPSAARDHALNAAAATPEEALPLHTPGPWGLCHHLESAENDAACPCGYRGGIWGPDGERTICEMGSTLVPGEEGLEAPRYPRPVELANARLIAAAPDLAEALDWLLASIEADPANDRYPGDREERLTLACGGARIALAKALGPSPVMAPLEGVH